MTPAIVFPSTFVQSTSLSGTRTMSPSFKLEVGDFARAFLVTEVALLQTFSVAFSQRDLRFGDKSCLLLSNWSLSVFKTNYVTYSSASPSFLSPSIFQPIITFQIKVVLHFLILVHIENLPSLLPYLLQDALFLILCVSDVLILLMQQIIGNTDPILALFNSFRSTDSWGSRSNKSFNLSRDNSLSPSLKHSLCSTLRCCGWAYGYVLMPYYMCWWGWILGKLEYSRAEPVWCCGVMVEANSLH